MPNTNELNKENSLNPTQLFELLHKIHVDFMQHTISLEDLCDNLLKVLLQYTRSEYGYIGSVHNNGKQKHLKSYSTNEIYNNEESKKNYVENATPTVKKPIDQNSFFYSVMSSGQPIINNEISKQNESIGIPFDHPAITNFMGFSIKYDGEVIGVLGIANRKEGYTKELLNDLDPFIKSCSSLFHSKMMLEYNSTIESKLERFKIALDESAIVATTDQKGDITYINDKFLEISKYSREELIGKNHRIINSAYHPKEYFTELWKTIANGEIWKGIIKNEAKDGTFYWVKSTIVPFKGKNGKPYEYLAIRYDITQQKLIEEKLLKQNEELDQFTSIVSHDLKVPLRGIGTMVDFLEEDLPELNEDSKENLHLIKSRIKRLNSFIDGLLSYSKVGKDQRILSEVSIEKILNDSIDVLCFSDNVTIHLDENMPVLPSSSPLLLGQIFSNIISNSVLHNDKEKIEISIECKTRKYHHEFRISDNGPGIPPKLRDKVFEIFQTLKTKDDSESTGVGLAIVKKIVEELKGSIAIEDNTPCGTTFVFTHPK